MTNSDVLSFEEFKRNLYLIEKEARAEGETFLNGMRNLESWISTCMNEGNIERNQFLVTEFLSQILKIILARNFDDRKHEEIIFLVLKSCFKFLVQNIHLEGSVSCLTVILDKNHSFYRNHGIKRYRPVSSEQTAFLKSLYDGMVVQYYDSRHTWQMGEIISVTNNKVSLCDISNNGILINLTPSEQVGKLRPWNYDPSAEPLLTSSVLYYEDEVDFALPANQLEWKFSLAIGDFVFLNCFGSSILSCILDIYDTTDGEDRSGKRFFRISPVGFNKDSDRWISIYSKNMTQANLDSRFEVGDMPLRDEINYFFRCKISNVENGFEHNVFRSISSEYLLALIDESQNLLCYFEDQVKLFETNCAGDQFNSDSHQVLTQFTKVTEILACICQIVELSVLCHRNISFIVSLAKLLQNRCLLDLRELRSELFESSLNSFRNSSLFYLGYSKRYHFLNEKIFVNVAVSFFESELLNKKLFGLKLLCEFVKRGLNSQNSNNDVLRVVDQSSSSNVLPLYSYVYRPILYCLSLQSHLVDLNNAFAKIFSPDSSHPSLIERSRDMMKSLALKELLDKNIILSIINSVFVSDEKSSIAVLEDLISALPFGQLQNILDELGRFDHSVKLVDFISSIIVRCRNNILSVEERNDVCQAVHDCGIDFVINICNLSNRSDPLFNHCLSKFGIFFGVGSIEVVWWANHYDRCLSYVKRFSMLLSSPSYFEISCKFFRDYIISWPNTGLVKDYNRSSIVCQLENEFSILSKSFDMISQLFNPLNSPSLSLIEKINFQHTFLDFVIFFCSNSQGLKIRSSLIEEFCRVTISGLSVDEIENILTFFLFLSSQKFFESSDELICSLEDIKVMFENLFNNKKFLRSSSFSQKAYECMERCFLWTNFDSGLLSFSSNVGIYDFFFDLSTDIGQWNLFVDVILFCPDESVATRAINFLCSLPYKYPCREEFVPYISSLRLEMTNVCMSELGLAVREDNIPNRAFAFLESIIHESYFDSRLVLRPHNIKRYKLLRLKCIFHSSFGLSDSTVFISISNHLAIYDLLKRIESICHKSSNDFRVIHFGSELSSQNFKASLLDKSFRENDVLHILERKSSNTPIIPCESLVFCDKQLPAFRISQDPKYMDVLFHFLDCRDSVLSSKVWSIISYIPTMSMIRNKWIAMDSSSVFSLFDTVCFEAIARTDEIQQSFKRFKGDNSPSFSKVLYNLEIVDEILFLDTCSEFEFPDYFLSETLHKGNWTSNFLGNEGYQFLCGIISHCNLVFTLDNQNSPRFVCEVLSMSSRILCLLSLTIFHRCKYDLCEEILTLMEMDVFKNFLSISNTFSEVITEQDADNFLSHFPDMDFIVVFLCNYRTFCSRYCLEGWFSQSMDENIHVVVNCLFLTLAIKSVVLSQLGSFSEYDRFISSSLLGCHDQNQCDIINSLGCSIGKGMTNYFGLAIKMDISRPIVKQIYRELLETCLKYLPSLSVKHENFTFTGMTMLITSLMAPVFDSLDQSDIVLMIAEKIFDEMKRSDLKSAFVDTHIDIISFFEIFGSLLTRNSSARKILLRQDLVDFLLIDLIGLFSNLDETFCGAYFPYDSRIRKVISICYSILNSIVDSDPLYCIAIQNYLSIIHSALKDPEPLIYDPLANFRSSFGFLGVRNKGSTCYMNSIIQVLFMLPEVRSTILSFKTCHDSSDDIKNDYLIQLQRFFISLQCSLCSSYDPSDWLFCYKDSTEINPINVMEQQDAQEFLEILCERIEKSLRSKSIEGVDPNIFQQSFSGTFCDQLSKNGKEGFSSSEDTRENISSFLTVAVTVKGVSNLEESLERFVSEEVISDYAWDDSKITIQKRQLFSTLPSNLIFTLKRFDINFDTFVREKINDFFSFPLELNMLPFTRDGNYKNKDVNPIDYLYDLYAVVVHSGSADFGHYFSFVKSPCGSSWIEFNDSTIRSCDVSFVDERCFGGLKPPSYSDSMSDFTSAQDYSSENAYLLVYRRKGLDVSSVVPIDVSKLVDSSLVLSELSCRAQVDLSQDYEPIETEIKAICSQNRSLVSSFRIFSDLHIDFFGKCIQSMYSHFSSLSSHEREEIFDEFLWKSDKQLPLEGISLRNCQRSTVEYFPKFLFDIAVDFIRLFSRWSHFKEGKELGSIIATIWTTFFSVICVHLNNTSSVDSSINTSNPVCISNEIVVSNESVTSLADGENEDVLETKNSRVIDCLLSSNLLRANSANVLLIHLLTQNSKHGLLKPFFGDSLIGNCLCSLFSSILEVALINEDFSLWKAFLSTEQTNILSNSYLDNNSKISIDDFGDDELSLQYAMELSRLSSNTSDVKTSSNDRSSDENNNPSSNSIICPQSSSLSFVVEITSNSSMVMILENWRQSQAFLNFSFKVCQMSPEIQDIYLRREVVAQYIDIIMGDRSPLCDKVYSSSKRKCCNSSLEVVCRIDELGTLSPIAYGIPDWSDALRIITLLLKRPKWRSIIDPLSLSLLLSSDFYSTLVWQVRYVELLPSILNSVFFNCSFDQDKIILDVIHNMFENPRSELIFNIFTLITSFLNIVDGNAAFRATSLFGLAQGCEHNIMNNLVQNLKKSNIGLLKKQVICVSIISVMNIGLKNHDVKNVLLQYHRQWAPSFLKFTYQFQYYFEQQVQSFVLLESDIAYLEVFGLVSSQFRASWLERANVAVQLLTDFLVSIGADIDRLIPEDTFSMETQALVAPTSSEYSSSTNPFEYYP